METEGQDEPGSTEPGAMQTINKRLPLREQNQGPVEKVLPLPGRGPSPCLPTGFQDCFELGDARDYGQSPISPCSKGSF